MSPINRRRSRRVDTSLTVKISCGKESFSARILNLSPNGLCVGTGTPLEEGSAITADFSLPPSEVPLQIPGRVAWKRPPAPGEDPPMMGVEFTEVPDGDKTALLLYIARSQVTVKGY
jgi:uncharacterized protein (TIGR02266 family)